MSGSLIVTSVDFHYIFGRRLEILLDKNKMTQTDLAKRVFVTPSSVNRWIHGSATPDAEIIFRICSELNVSANWLLGLSGDIGRGKK